MGFSSMYRHLSWPVFEPVFSPLYWPAELLMNTWWLLTLLHNFRTNQGECLEPLYFQIFLFYCLFVWKQGKLEPKYILSFGLKNIAVLYNGADGERQGLLLRVSIPFHKSCEFTVTPSSCLCLAELAGPKRAWSLDCLQDAPVHTQPVLAGNLKSEMQFLPILVQPRTCSAY